jgi:hypothetical protein
MEKLLYVMDMLQIMKSKPEYVHLYNELIPQLKELNKRQWYHGTYYNVNTRQALEMDLCMKAISEMHRLYSLKKWNSKGE